MRDSLNRLRRLKQRHGRDLGLEPAVMLISGMMLMSDDALVEEVQQTAIDTLERRIQGKQAEMDLPNEAGGPA